ncbi:MAG: AAA family ATPase [Peptococcaceae bacterium]|nr:AAA family ATPase [Peptococcaceae bacterium]
MKPLCLSFYGLNSFKEEQTIDFASLCNGRVFGIFGPTGSGKSTIIDAITLALYGKVERAPDKVRGIVNRNMTEAGVSFEFSLGGENKARVYRVERKYVTKEESTLCRLARLCEITSQGVEVIADKPNQVDQRVEQILGLTVHDFTRAVVLPQGKFAEFLSLKGRERREMLERIFNLSEYGERLLARVTVRAKELDTQLMKIEGEQQGLGQASKDDLLALQGMVEASDRALTKAMAELAAGLEHWEEAKTVYELQEKSRQVNVKRQAMSLARPYITDLEARLGRLLAAESIWPLAAEFDASDRKKNESIERSSATGMALAVASEREKVAAEGLETAKAMRQSEEPLLLALQQDLKRAMLIAEELRGLESLRSFEQEATRHSEILHSGLQAQLEGLLAREQQAQADRRLLAHELLGTAISPEERSMLAQAVQAESRLLEVRRQLHERFAEEKTRHSSLEKAMSTLTQAEQNVVVLEHEHHVAKDYLDLVRAQEVEEMPPIHLERLNRCRLILQDARFKETQAQRLLLNLDNLRQKQSAEEKQLTLWQDQLARVQERVVSLRSLVTETDRQAKEARESCLVAELASQVAPGEKCPVCGSRQHPELAARYIPADVENFVAAASEAHALLQKSLAEEGRVASSAFSCFEGLKDLGVQMAVLAAEIKSMEDEVTRLCSSLPSIWAGIAAEEVDKKINQEEKTHETAREGRRMWLENMERAQKTERQVADKLSKAKAAHAVAEQHTANQKGELQNLTVKLQALGNEEIIASAALDERLRELDCVDLEKQRELMQTKDRKQKALSDTLKQLEDKLAALHSMRQDNEKALAQAQEDLMARRMKLGELLARIELSTRDLAQLAGNEDPFSRAQMTEATLQSLREREKGSQDSWATATKEVNLAMSEDASAKEAERLVVEAAVRAEEKFAESLQGSVFTSREDLEDARVYLAHRALWAEEVRVHGEQETLLGHEANSLCAALAGRAISDENWARTNEDYDNLQLARDEALRQTTLAGEKLRDMQARHERFMLLEQERTMLDQEHALVTEICWLLRGNALVEFMAGEHLQAVTTTATEWLRMLSSQRYALEVDPEGGFLIRDDAEGGLRRPVHTLSGGETFITSLALALSLSLQIQLRGQFPLEFFFLDEGFGTLDPELLETVMDCLERMPGQGLSIGIISHVQELVERLPRKIIVTPAEHSGRGSRVKITL